jgi:uncharacterized GH25 family protein
MKNWLIPVLVIVGLFTALPLHAHSLWLNMEENEPTVGQTVRVEIGWGHKFPKDEVIKEGLLKEVYGVDSHGARTPLKQISLTEFEFVPKAPGGYTLSANTHPGFVSKTPEGYKLQSKKGLEDVVSCFRYDIRTKAFVYVGHEAKVSDQALGDILEIIPLKTPKDLKKGETLPVKILFEGKPLPAVEVKATYAGFSDQPHTFAVSTKTDTKGVAQIDILEKGDWLVNVVHEVPYPHAEECDKHRNNYSFTFKVD